MTASFLDLLQRRVQGLGYQGTLLQTTSPDGVELLTSLGYRPVDHLTVLKIPASTIREVRAPKPPKFFALRRASDSDTDAIVQLDQSTFEPFWRLDAYGLSEAVLSTPRSRFRVIEDLRPGAKLPVVGYCIVGSGAGLGYLQRLAVSPTVQRQGLARALVIDGLHWVTRWRGREVIVNTQSTNSAALALYEALGFVRYGYGITLCSSLAGL
jgi:ribosomal protein S18 acetylase RimI-like enzyme